MKRRISKQGLWSLIVLKTSDTERWDMSSMPEDERERADELLQRLVSNLRTEQDIDRLVKVLNKVADGNALEALERLVMLF